MHLNIVRDQKSRHIGISLEYSPIEEVREGLEQTTMTINLTDDDLTGTSRGFKDYQNNANAKNLWQGE